MKARTRSHLGLRDLHLMTSKSKKKKSMSQLELQEVVDLASSLAGYLVAEAVVLACLVLGSLLSQGLGVKGKTLIEVQVT